MNDRSCDSVAEELVAYADGELSAGEADRVAEHLAVCTRCRGELRRLRRSLELAQEVWQRSAARAPAPARYRRGLGRRQLSAAACLAGCAVLLLLVAGPWLFSGREPGGRAGPGGGVEGHAAGAPAEEEEVDVAVLIAREARAARLASAAEMLASQPGLEDYTREARQYLVETYRGTAVVDGGLPPSRLPMTKEPES